MKYAVVFLSQLTVVLSGSACINICMCFLLKLFQIGMTASFISLPLNACYLVAVLKLGPCLAKICNEISPELQTHFANKKVRTVVRSKSTIPIKIGESYQARLTFTQVAMETILCASVPVC